MTRNQLSPNLVKKLSGGVMFTVTTNGYIAPTTQQTVNQDESILTSMALGSTSPFNGHVCARQDDVCKCSILVADLFGAPHMAVGTVYAVSSTVSIGSDFELYAVPDSGPVAGATNGNIHIGG